MKKKFKKILSIIGVVFILTLNVSPIFAAELSQMEYKGYQTVIDENQFFVSMIDEIFSVQEDLPTTTADGTEIFNVETSINNLTEVCVDALKKWGQSTFYYMFLGIGVFILLIRSSINYSSNRISKEKMTIEQMIRIGMRVLLSFIIILNINNILIGLLTFFRFILANSLNLAKTTDLIRAESIQAFSKAEIIAYNILKGVGADNASIVNQALNANGQTMLLTIKYLIPWLVCMAGKVGILFAVIITELEILVNGMMYPIAAGDSIEELKNSSFMIYTKRILALMFRLLIIIIVIIGTQILLNGYVNELLEKASQIYTSGVTRQTEEEIFKISLILSIIQLAKTILAIASSVKISKAVLGVGND